MALLYALKVKVLISKTIITSYYQYQVEIYNILDNKSLLLLSYKWMLWHRQLYVEHKLHNWAGYHGSLQHTITSDLAAYCMQTQFYNSLDISIHTLAEQICDSGASYDKALIIYGRNGRPMTLDSYV